MREAAVLVEGESDRAAVLALAATRGADLDGVDVVAMGGITNVARYVAELVPQRLRLAGLYDAGEERFVRGALERAGLQPGPGARGLAELGFHCCDRDLEDELIRALGPDRVEAVLDELGELDRFRAFQRQPQWRGRPVGDQLRRFAGTASGRKLTLARRLAEELAPGSTPRPLASLVDAIADRAAR